MATNPNIIPKAVELTQAQLATIAGGGSVTKDGNTYTADAGTLYLTEDTSVLFEAQNLTNEQKAQARTNIGAGTGNSDFSGSYNDLTDKPTLGTVSALDSGTSSGNVPVLDSNGKLSTSVLPALAITDTFVVANESAMLALTAQVGDVAVRTDLNKSFILKTDGASTLANWQELLSPTGDITSVNGQTGVVVLTASDVGALPDNTSFVANVSYDSTNKKLQKTIGSTTSDVVTFGANAFTDTTIPAITSTDVAITEVN